MLLHAGQLFGLMPTSGLGALAIGLGPTLVFLPVLFWIIWRHRGDQPPAAVGRAIGAAFGAIGAGQPRPDRRHRRGRRSSEHSLAIWLIYPCCVFLLQGAAWLVAWIMRRRAWLGLVAGGWFVFAIAMGLTHRPHRPLPAVLRARHLDLHGAARLAAAARRPQEPPEAEPMAGFDIGRIDDVIHGRMRLGIMAYLADAEVADFNELKRGAGGDAGQPLDPPAQAGGGRLHRHRQELPRPQAADPRPPDRGRPQGLRRLPRGDGGAGGRSKRRAAG